MTAKRRPKPEPTPTRVTVLWPMGPYHFFLEDVHEVEMTTDPLPGWVWIRGLVVVPVRPGTPMQTFHARPINCGYELLPANRDSRAIWAATGGKL